MKIKIAIIDNGVWTEHPEFKQRKELIQVKTNYSVIPRRDNGHGTAIYSIISKGCPDAEIINFDICDGEEVEENVLCDCLEDILNNYDIDIINISMGILVCDSSNRLKSLCDKLFNKRIIIVSAFANCGAISYPAAFNTVIGVTSSNECRRTDEFTLYDDCIVNIGAKGNLQRVVWNGPEYIMVSGNSFACAHVTVQVAKFLQSGKICFNEIISEFRKIAIYDEEKKERVVSNKCNFKIDKAVLFPFNKEMHALLRYEELLDFEIVGVYDVKYSSLVGTDTSHIMNAEVSAYKVRNIETIDWEEFNTIILGHLHKLSSLLPHQYIDNIIKIAISKNKNIYSYDDISHNYSYDKLFCPAIDDRHLPHFRMGKLFNVNKPVLGIFGTSSAQGKFTLQLELRKRFIEGGYRVGQIGTEPNSLLFNMDYAFPIGYSSSVSLWGHDVIRYVNYMIHDLCDNGNVDIVIVGSQSSVIPYDTSNLSMYPVKQYNFLLGVQPDAIILCINPYDDIRYIHRSINFLESTVECKVIALCMFPMDIKSDWSALYGQKQNLTIERYLKLKEVIITTMGLPVFLLGNNNEMEQLYSCVIDFFS